MTSSTLLSVKEAADLAGVSKKTIERAYKKHLDDPRFHKLIEKREHGSGYRYFVTRSFVEKCVVRPRSSAERAQRKNDDSDPAAVVALRHQLDVKDRRIDELMTMLSRKEEFSEALIRKGLNLPEGNASDEAQVRDTDEQANEEELTEDVASATVVDAEVVVQSHTPNKVADSRALFPTLKVGIGKVAALLRTEVLSKKRS